MNYEEKISLLDEQDFWGLFVRLGVEPRWVTSAGKQSIQIIGACHQGEHHSALFDPTTIKITCFSECGRGMWFHTWVMKAIGLSNPYEAKEYIEDWIENQDIDLTGRISKKTDFEYIEKPYQPLIINPVPGMPIEILDELNKRFMRELTGDKSLSNLVWSKVDGILAQTLLDFDVAYDPVTGSVMLPHHNELGEIVGIYERSFKPLRREIKNSCPDLTYKQLLSFPRAKYVPLLRDEQYRTEEKTSWSFPNSQNLYGLHKAKNAIKETGIALVFEGGKSVMLAHQMGYPFSVATHTFGAHLNHISMLINCGAKEIVLAFDKQYEDKSGQPWILYEKKTKQLASKVNKFVKVSRIIDDDNLIDYKDAPIDKGKDIFDYLFQNRNEITDFEILQGIINNTLVIPYEMQRNKEMLNQLKLRKRRFF